MQLKQHHPHPTPFTTGNKLSVGRPKGSTNKLSVKVLLEQISDTVGKPYEQQLAENYHAAILENNKKIIHAYDHLFLSKLLADKVDLTLDSTVEQIDAKREAFMSVLQQYGQAVQAQATVDTVAPLQITVDTVTIVDKPSSDEPL
jgi:hypothetical protein